MEDSRAKKRLASSFSIQLLVPVDRLPPHPDITCRTTDIRTTTYRNNSNNNKIDNYYCNTPNFRPLVHRQAQRLHSFKELSNFRGNTKLPSIRRP